MCGWLCLILYRVVLWRARGLSRERGHALRAKWALRFYALTTSGLDDDFTAELYELVQEMPELLNQLERQASGTGRIARQKQALIGILRQAHTDGAQNLY